MYSKQHRSWLTALILSVGLSLSTLTGCSVGNSRTDVTINGTRKIEQKQDGVTRKLETNDAVVFEDGAIATLPAGAVLKLQETNETETIKAELREQDGKQALFIEVGDSFRASTPEEQAWLQEFLEAMKLEDRDPADLALTNLQQAESPLSETLPATLADLSTSDKTELLQAVIEKLELSTADQASVADAIIDDVTFASDQVDLLMALIERPDFSSAAEKTIRDRLDDISFKSNQEEIQDALNNRGKAGDKNPSNRQE